MSTVISEEDQCFKTSKLQCEETVEQVQMEVCGFTYESKEIPQPATMIDIEFEKACTTQMVTVCKPQRKKILY